MDLFKKIISLLSVCTIVSFGEPLVSNSSKPINCLTLNNWPWQARPTHADVNSN